ncbi:HDIG domain-containing protein [Candidatus Woesebacteria bacterium]|nr:HDIG domain-containing protein [Candidatus Woesebacteria bacterium]
MSDQLKQLPPREQSQALLQQYIKNEALRRHCSMVAQAMEAYAKLLNQDVELWYQTGLLHDLDWEQYPDEHPNRAIQELLVNYPAELLQAIAAHAPSRTGKQPESQLDKYLFACDELSGFLNAYSLMRPEGFVGMKTSSVLKKLRDKSFAANVNRDDIQQGFELIEKDPSQHVEFMIGVFDNS